MALLEGRWTWGRPWGQRSSKPWALGCGPAWMVLLMHLPLNFRNTPVEPGTLCCLVQCVSLDTE